MLFSTDYYTIFYSLSPYAYGMDPLIMYHPYLCAFCY